MIFFFIIWNRGSKLLLCSTFKFFMYKIYKNKLYKIEKILLYFTIYFIKRQECDARFKEIKILWLKEYLQIFYHLI
jgi:hypothetical protein